MHVFVVTIYLAVFGICRSAETINTAAAAVTEFSVDLLKKLHEEGKNTFFSGYNIAMALGMMSLGAGRNTLTEIDNSIHFDKVNTVDSKAIHKAFKSLAETYDKPNDKFLLTIANRLYGRSTYKIEHQYEERVKKFYGSELQLVDFSTGTAEGIINDWVANKTNDKIRNFFSPGSLDASTILVLVNTIYFKANWEKQFRNEDTKNAKFNYSKGKRVLVKMMHQTRYLNYYSDLKLNVKVLELPYVVKDLSMFIILPHKANGLTNVVNSLTAKKLEILMNSGKSEHVEVELPRFKLETEYSLVAILQKLGIHDLFNPKKCNLSAVVGRNSDKNIYVSKAIHKTFVQVAEEGTEVATVIGFQKVPKTKLSSFIANHPFLFVIRDTANKIPLFVGIVSNLLAADESTSTIVNK